MSLIIVPGPPISQVNKSTHKVGEGEDFAGRLANTLQMRNYVIVLKTTSFLWL